MRQIYLLVILSLLIETTNAKEMENREQGGATKIGFNKDDIKDFNSSDDNKSIDKKIGNEVSSDINKSIDINRNQDLNDWIKKFFRN